MNDLSSKIAERAENTALAKTGENGKVRLTKNMSLTDMIKAMEPEIKRALPSVLTPERFTRMALSAVNNTPELAACTPMSFIAALMNAAQLGLEPNTPLGQAYLIPYKNKKTGEDSFTILCEEVDDISLLLAQMLTFQSLAV